MADFSYFRTPQFAARMRSVNDEMRRGFPFPMERVRE